MAGLANGVCGEEQFQPLICWIDGGLVDYLRKDVIRWISFQPLICWIDGGLVDSDPEPMGGEAVSTLDLLD